MSGRLRCFLYSQPLLGTGHFVRTFEIARALARCHDVFMVDGCRPIPRRTPEAPLTRINVPPIYRMDKGVVPVDESRGLDDVMAERKKALIESIDMNPPDVLFIEHFPFSKWELSPEIITIIEGTRKRNERAKVICSVRDIVPMTPRESNLILHRSRVLKTLDHYFDAMLVHADPRIVRLEDHVSWAKDIDMPMEYTGYVSEKPNPVNAKADRLKSQGPAGPSDGMAVVSTGGGGNTELIFQCIQLWKDPRFAWGAERYTLVICVPLFCAKDAIRKMEEDAQGANIVLTPFTPDFIDYMRAADFSISHAGYNTCANILETRTRAVVVPDITMSDQLPRAELLSRRGIVAMLHPGILCGESLMKAIQEILDRPIREHGIDLEGAENTRVFVESLVNVRSTRSIVDSPA